MCIKMRVTVLLVFLATCFVQLALGAEICYEDLGCFDNSNPCHRPWFPPAPPAKINTRFYLYTRLNAASDNYQLLNRSDGANIRASLFDARLPTKFVIHGYIDTIFSPYFLQIKESLLKMENLNVIMVDWSVGARGWYNLCTQNIRVVGREVALLAQALNREKGASYSDMHLIGHSLGAHTAGYAGEFQPGFARITGLDPAGPEFRGVGEECRLGTTDAAFVDIIHSNGELELSFGTDESIGHADFFPNGGREMPGCRFLNLSCDHFRAIYYFDESIRSTDCSFKAYPCTSWARYQDGLCTQCGIQGCPEMGYHANKMYSRSNGSFYLETNGKSPYCKK